MEKEKSWWQKYGWVVILVLIVFVILYVAYKTYREQKNETREEIDLKLRLYEGRKNELKKIISHKKSIKKKLESYVSLSYFFTRMCIVGLVIFLLYSTNYFYANPNIGDYLSILAAYALLFTGVCYLIFGVPNNVTSVLKEVKPKIEIWIYRNYLGMDESISTDEKELSAVEKEIQVLNDKLRKVS